MSKSLIITEKPSVAGDIAKALGGFKKGKDYYENEKYLISWAVGHLFELVVPASMKEQDKWDMKKLPIMPAEFELAPAEKMGGRVNVLRKLIRQKCFGNHKCVRRRPGRRIDLSLHHPVRRHEKTDQASLAAIDDARSHSRRLRAVAQRR